MKTKPTSVASILLQVYQSFQRQPVHVQTQPGFLVKNSKVVGRSLDSWLQCWVAEASEVPEERVSLLEKSRALLFATFDQLHPKLAVDIMCTEIRSEWVQAVNDSATGLDELEELLIAAYFAALMEEDPCTEFTTLEQAIANLNPEEAVWQNSTEEARPLLDIIAKPDTKIIARELERESSKDHHALNAAIRLLKDQKLPFVVVSESELYKWKSVLDKSTSFPDGKKQRKKAARKAVDTICELLGIVRITHKPV